MKITYLPHSDIDKQKWDACIDTAGNGLVYAYSFYLDAMGKHWDALILNDYEIVMPLTWNKKYTIYYLYQPFFCAQLGIFGNNITEEVLQNFFSSVPSKFKYWDFYLNPSNLFFIKNYPLYERSNYVVSLKKSYDELAINYADSHARNIRRALGLRLTVKKNISLKDVIRLAKNQSQKFSPVTKNDYDNFLLLFSVLKEKNMAVTYGVYNKLNELMASCAFFFSHKRMYYILAGNHPDGRTSGASHAMIDAVIKEYAGQDLLLDFEGSNVASLAFFYKSFGASLEKYPGIKRNTLPAIARLFKH